MSKVIYTCNKKSKAYEHLINKADQVIHMQLLNFESRILLYKNKFLNHFSNKLSGDMMEYIEKSDVCGNPLFLTLFLRFALTNVQKIRKVVFTNFSFEGVEELLEYILDYYAEVEFKKETILKFLKIISMTRSGISEEELLRLINCKHYSLLSLKELFSPLLHNSEGFYILKHDIFSAVISKKNQAMNESLHIEIIKVLDDHKLTIRKIDELLYHLYKSKD